MNDLKPLQTVFFLNEHRSWASCLHFIKMAEATSVKQNNVVCRYFLSSGCRDGDKCLFSHDSTHYTPDSVCRYYLQGICVYGQNCRYDHVKVNKEGNSKPHYHNDRHSAGSSRHSANGDVLCNFSSFDRNKSTSHQPIFNSSNCSTYRNEVSSTSGSSSTSSNWINAPEFVPKHRRYADATNTVSVTPEIMPSTELCEHFTIYGECPLYLQCPYVHGDICELCHKACLHPNDEKQRKAHMEQCEKELEQDGNKKNLYRPIFNSLNYNTYRNEASCTNGQSSTLSNWINAPEFVPKHTLSYADIVKANTVSVVPERMPSTELCQYFTIVGECPLGPQCSYVHGDICELCHKACLHPNDEKQRKVHIEQCEKELEQDMELSFAIQLSMDKTCGICMDVVLEKEPKSERKFGILENCNHVYCLSCIRKWRRSKQTESHQDIDNALDLVVTKTCPECRIVSNFVTPSNYYVDTEEEKKKLITEYKKALRQKDCKYFKKGEGTCPFGGSCFYLHAKPDGKEVELPLPARRRRQNQDGELDFMDQIFLSDYLEYREENIVINLNLIDFIFTSSDSDDDDS